MTSSKLKMRDDLELYLETTLSESENWIVWVHGICEHLGRYQHLEELFGDKYNILKFDLRGHGKSDGERVQVSDFTEFVEDLDEVILHLKNTHNSPKYILMGHSMGGLIVAGYMQNKVHRDYYPQGVFFNSAPAGLPGAGGMFAKAMPQGLTGALAHIKVGANFKGLVELEALSHDSQVAKDYVADKLNSLVIHSSLMFNLVDYGKQVFSKPLGVSCPIFAAVGSEDRVVSPKTLIDFTQNIDQTVKMKVFEGAFHELHNEIDEYKLPFFEYMKECIDKIPM